MKIFLLVGIYGNKDGLDKDRIFRGFAYYWGGKTWLHII